MPSEFAHTKNFYKALTSSFNKLNEVAAYQQTVLGHAHGLPLLLIHPAKSHPDKAHILVAAGFHGDEPAGPKAVLRYMNTAAATDLKDINISFLPLVNPTGYALKQRVNAEGEDPNRGFPHAQIPCPADTLSAEGRILFDKRRLIAKVAADGFVSLHENIDDHNQSYLFAYEASDSPGDFSCRLRDAQKRYYPMKNGIADDDFPEIVMTDGLAFNPPAFNCFEDLLVYDLNIPKVATTETAGSDRMSRRVQCNTAIIRAFVQHYTHK